MLKGIPPIKGYQMLPWYVGKNMPRLKVIDFEAAIELLMKEDDKRV